MTNKLDEIAEEGYDLNNWGTQFIVIHALQIQAQIMIDLRIRLLSNIDSAFRTIVTPLRN